MDRTGVVHIDKVVYPKLCSAKYDGNRCYIENGVALSSSGKPIRNRYIRNSLSMHLLDGFDGEIIVGSPTSKSVRRDTSSGVGTFDGEPDFTFYVFDNYSAKGTFAERLEILRKCVDIAIHPRVKLVKHKHIYCLEELLNYEARTLTCGYEGVILRDANAPYKEGRATIKQNWALKLKRFVDAEATVTGFFERMHNDNEATINEHGNTARSSHKENKRPAGDLGGLEVTDNKTGVSFRVGTGFDATQRTDLWNRRHSLTGLTITYKHFPIGAKDKPNLPSFVAFRDLDDIGDAS